MNSNLGHLDISEEIWKRLHPLEPVSKLSIKEIENNNSAREIKRCKIIFRFSFPTDKDSPESIVPTVRSFNDPSSRLSFIFTDQWFLASSSNVRPDISSSN
ncbi:AAA family ATPase [Leptospira sp. ZV016]|nr:AAA family ATPase [Leptospira sp. ZV016]